MDGGQAHPRKRRSSFNDDGTPREPQPIAVGAIAHVIRRNTAIPVTDGNGEPLLTSNGKPAVKNLLEVADFTPHDLRRTVATFMSQLGMLDEVIDAVLNHTKTEDKESITVEIIYAGTHEKAPY